ncbi:Asp23/Gls24 family envelope stress response protein [Streptomyces sp. NPDC004589]|uniref:Asp23/Gls24 family envelope stress response protein n=1 Tax=Streptomyces sp. NPDC004589 TaxID=3154553 RepID=UPI0033A5A1FB
MSDRTVERERGGGSRRAGGAVAPAERGATRIADLVVAKIAAQAAQEALGPLPPEAAPPHATVVVLHHPADPARGATNPTGTARVGVSLELGYPCDIGGRCGAVRRRVVERVGALAGMEVHEVAVQVERLHPGPAQGRTQ